ncbi:MAG: PQQ-binding-like beta-propeller repeat protein [Haloarculaceae archaeon]
MAGAFAAAVNWVLRGRYEEEVAAAGGEEVDVPVEEPPATARDPLAYHRGDRSAGVAPSTYVSRRGLVAAVGGGLASVAAGALRPATVLPALDASPRVPSGGWPTHKRDPARTGYQPEPGPHEGLVERWRQRVGPHNAVVPGLVATGGRVLTVGRYATRALSAADGSPDWTTRRRDPFGAVPGEPYEFVQAGPVVAGDRALVVSGSSLHALGVGDGSHDWTLPTTSSFGSVLAVGNAVFAGVSLSGGDRLVALDRAGGVPRWQRDSGGVPLAFAPDAGLLLATADPLGEDGTLVARDPADGSVVWRERRPGYPFAPRWTPAVADARVYAGRGPVYALSAADGSEAWSAPLDGLDLDADHGPVTDGERVYLSGEATALALDAATGERRWTVPVGTTSLAPPVLAGDTLYVPTPTAVVALRTDDGSERFRHEPPDIDGTVRGLVAADGRLYLRDDRTVRALEGER